MESKITEEQLKQVQEQQKKLNDILYEVGYLETTQHGLMHKFASVNSEMEEYRKKLFEEYGPIDINIETGTYTKVNKEKVNV